MNELKIFENEEFGQIRVIEKGSKPWFVGKDVVDILGYQNGSRDIDRHVDEEDRIKYKISTAGQMRERTIINEFGLYSLILNSKLPEAKRFKKWVTSEVIPSIHKRSGYIVGQENLSQEEFLAKALLVSQSIMDEYKNRNEELENMVAVQEQQIAEMQPKTSYYDVVLNCEDVVSITEIAKDYGWSGERMNTYLREKGIQFRQEDIWLLYQEYAQMGYTSIKTRPIHGKDGVVHARPHTYWTQKGRLFLYEILKADGHLPLIECGMEEVGE